jgi:hypothetical protein
MKERIQELARQAGVLIDWGEDIKVGRWGIGGNYKNMQKFAELLVKECAVYCEGHILPKGMAEENGLNYNDGVMDCAIGLKQDFGVE